MATTETASELKALLHARRPRAWAQGYPAVVRERVRVYTAKRRAEGATPGVIAEELGLSRHSVLAWTVPPPEVARLRPVEVVADAPPSSAPAPAQRRLALISPKGYRVEGLDVAALAELLAVIG